MANLLAAFQEAAGTEDNATIAGAAGVEALLQTQQFKTSGDEVKTAFEVMGWDDQYLLSWNDFQQLAIQLKIDEAEETATGDEEDRANELAQPPSEVIDTIAARMAENKFPYVNPDELGDHQETINAEAALAYSQEVEAVEIKSFIDAEKAKYAANNPGDEALSREVKDAQWVHRSFYPLMREFLYTKALEEKKFDHRMSDDGFVPLLAVASLEDGEQREMATAATKKSQRRTSPSSMASCGKRGQKSKPG